MAKQNAYLAKQEAVQRQCFNDGWELGTQQMCDYISLALRDPETMGKDTFSGARILKVLKKTNEIMQYFRVAVGDNWWLERAEYDGSEWWEFKTIPKEPRWGGHAFSCDLGIGATG